MKKLIIVVLFAFTAVCLAQTYTLEIHAAIDGEPEYCDSLLALVGASPGAGIHDIHSGDSIEISLDTTLVEVALGTRDSCYGWTATGSSCPTADTCRGDGTTLSFVMTENTIVIWNFKRQFTFEVNCEAGGSFYAYDSPEPYYGVHWFDAYDTITASVAIFVDSVTYRVYCLGFEGTGSVETWGHGHNWTGFLEEPSSIKWIISFEYPPCSLLVISDHGPCMPTPGVWNYFIRGTEITAYTSAVDSTDSALGMIYTCIGWRGEGCVPATGPTPYVPPYNMCEIACTTSGILEWLWDAIYTDISEDIALPRSISINVHPNPFNSAVTITLDGVGAGLAPALVEIFDVNGRRVAQLPEHGIVGAGLAPARNDGARDNDRDGARPSPTTREFTWSPDETLPSGIYLFRARVDPRSLSGAEANVSAAAVKRIVYLK